MPEQSLKSSTCHSCAIFPICFTIGLNEKELQQVDNVIEVRQTFHKGDMLFQPGDDFHGIYVLRSGSVKLYELTTAGEQRISAFHLPGELFGFDAADSQQHLYYCTALETSSICRISLEKLFELASKIKPLQGQLFRLMSHELAQTPLISLNTSAQQRLCKFLLNLAGSAKRRGLMANKIHFSMTREDIGLYLGLASETVSRLLKDLQKDKVIELNNRDVTICDMNKLQKLEQTH
jgi:CRP/FNR family transcriptional regulator